MDNYRRSLLKGVSAFSLLLACSFPVYAKPRQRKIVDILERDVLLPNELTQVYIADSGLFLLYDSLNQDALCERLIGVPSAFRTADLSVYRQYTSAFPQLLGLPEFTAMSSGHFNSES